MFISFLFFKGVDIQVALLITFRCPHWKNAHTIHHIRHQNMHTEYCRCAYVSFPGLVTTEIYKRKIATFVISKGIKVT